MTIEEEGVPWYYDIMKFLVLEVYPNNADKRERCSIRMMVMQYVLRGRSTLKEILHLYTPSLLEEGGSRKTHG